MDIRIREGNYEKFGTQVHVKSCVFTFLIKTEAKTAIHFYDRNTLQTIKTVEVPKKYREGRIVSIAIEGLVWQDVCYLLERDQMLEADEYATSLSGREKWNDVTRQKTEYRVFGNIQPSSSAWTDTRVTVLPQDMVMYKLHLRGFTMHNGLNETACGNYHGMIRKLKNLQKMGITTLEFLPLYDFEEIKYSYETKTVKTIRKEKEKKQTGRHAGKPEGINFWGYGPAYYFAPKASYFGGRNVEHHMKELIRQIHAHGMEIVMEFSFSLEVEDDYILDCLNFWAREYHIDGFHLFGLKMPLERIVKDPVLADKKIFYDQFSQEILQNEKAAFGKHLFVSDANFYYPLRRLQNHMDGSIIEFVNQMKRQNEHYGFVNFAADFNEFTLRDVYSYSEKHNEENKEENRDGNNFSVSHNFGIEGDTNNKSILNLRMRHIRTALAAVLLGQGIPLITAGDEGGNTQKGNNNAYCQDNDTGWVTFPRQKRYLELKMFTQELILFRKNHPVLSQDKPMQMSDYRHLGMPDLSYHGKEPWVMWLSEDKKSIGIFYYGKYSPTEEKNEDVMLCFNFFFGEDSIALPTLAENKKWYLAANTIEERFKKEPLLLENQKSVIVPGGSVSILIGKTFPQKTANKKRQSVKLKKGNEQKGQTEAKNKDR